MNIELTETTEAAIKQAVSSGRYDTAEAFLEAAAVNLASRLPRADQKRAKETPYQTAVRLGLIGTFEGPPDLSTNPKYMEGFGQ